MPQHDPYFQFPLSALAFGPEPVARLRHIVNMCCVEIGGEKMAVLNLQDAKHAVEEIPASDRLGGLRFTDRRHLAVALGMKTLNVRGGDASSSIRQANELSLFCRCTAGTQGASPLVRMKTVLVWDTIGGAMPYRTFSVLAAVYCMIGRQERPVRITRDRLQAAALGYKSSRLMTAETLAARPDKAAPLTVDQLRYTLNQLEGDNHFVRVQLSPRRVYFSNRLTRAEMETALLKTATKRGARLTAYRAADRKLQGRVQATIIAGKPDERSPRSPRSVPVKSPKIPHEVPTLIESVFIQPGCIQPNEIETQGIPTVAELPLSFVSESSKTIPERENIETLLRQAEEIGTPESLRMAESYRTRLAELQ